MNGYFRINSDDSGTKVKLYAPTDGGMPVNIKEITNYLDKNKIKYDLKILNDAIISLDSDSKELFLMPEKILPISESCDIYVLDNRMTAKVRFFPASNNGRAYDKEGILSELRIAKVMNGYDEAAIENFLNNKKYCTDYILAKGTAPIEGKDAFITYNFPTDNKARPTLNEDGTVDFFNLNMVNHCKVGDVLAVLTPEDKGTPGLDLAGNVIRPREVKKIKLSYGLNIDINEERTVLTSKVNGHVSLVDGKVFVADVMEVENVDTSTGNIEYEGNVKVNGNVCSNFTIISHGNIEVKGVVEGACLKADGNIILARGINGMSKGRLEAGGNVIAKFLENCSVTARGYVETESILHSNVQAGTEINVVSRKGFITGGKVCATNCVRVKTLGTAMGSDTEVMVGVDPVVQNRFIELNKEIVEIQKNLKVMLPVLDANKKKLAAGAKLLPEQIKNLQQLALNVKGLQEKAVADAREIEKLRTVMEDSSNAKIEVTGEVYAGTKITISDVSLVVKEDTHYCRFMKQQGVVSSAGL